jgi:hypothetical protein
MMRVTALKHKFVEYIPEIVEDGVIYVSIGFATAVHKCCCGCGNEVVTSLTPTDWKLIFDGETVSLDPSIGNWSFPCQSHYWIKRNTVQWARRWSQEEIAAGREFDAFAKQRQFSPMKSKATETAKAVPDESRPVTGEDGLWQTFKKWFWDK